MNYIDLTSTLTFGLPGTAHSEGTYFVVGLVPNVHSYHVADLVISARQTTLVNVTKYDTSETITVYENWSVHFRVDYDMRTDDGIETKGWYGGSRSRV